MASTFGKAKDVGEWTSNKEMNPAANSSATVDGLSVTEDRGGEQSWRESETDSKDNIQLENSDEITGKTEED